MFHTNRRLIVKVQMLVGLENHMARFTWRRKDL